MNIKALKARSLAITVIISVFLVIALFSAFTIVKPGERGIVIRLGSVQPGVLSEGIHFKVPFIDTVVPVEVRIQKEQSEQITASKDLQNVTTSIAVNFSLDPMAVNKLYQKVGLEYKKRIIDPATSEAMKAVTAQYTAEELITKRPEVSAEIKAALKEKLEKYDLRLEEISITNFKFSDEFNKAIEAKQTAEQNALKAQRDLDRIRIEAEQTVAQATAEAESLRLKKQEVTDELVRLKEIEVQEKAIEKWDGKMPNVTGGATPFINVGE